MLAVQFNVTECEPGWAPAPDNEIVAGELAASLVTVTAPVALDAAAGVKVTLSAAVCPGVRICPVETPLAVNPAPEMLTFEMVTLELPALANVTPRRLLLPIVTFSKFKLVELAFRREVAGTPDPLTATVAGELEALLKTETAPETFPVAVGENTTLNVDCAPALTVMGSEIPLTVIP